MDMDTTASTSEDVKSSSASKEIKVATGSPTSKVLEEVKDLSISNDTKDANSPSTSKDVLEVEGAKTKSSPSISKDGLEGAKSLSTFRDAMKGAKSPSTIPKCTQLGTWKNMENGAMFEAARYDYPSCSKKAATAGESLYTFNMDPNFLTADELNIFRRRVLFDEDGSDRKLTQLIQLYANICEQEMKKTTYNTFKEIVRNCDTLRTSAKKTIHAIFANLKASEYWLELQKMIKKEIDDLRPLMLGLRKKQAERELMEKKWEKESRIEAALSSTRADRKQMETEIRKLKRNIDAFKAREKELDILINERKVYIQHLILLSKELDSGHQDKLDAALVEVDNNVFGKNTVNSCLV